jgi:hypothetical protein
MFAAELGFIHLHMYYHLTYLSTYGCTAFVDLGRFFSFLAHTQSVGLLERGSACRKAAI